MGFTKTLVATALATTAAMALPSAAQAAEFFSFDGNSGVYGNADVNVSPFMATFTFETGAGLLSSTISSVGSGATNIDFTSVTLNGMEFAIVSTGFSELRQILEIPVLAGTQTVVVKGTGGLDGSYSGVLSFSQSGAVPEPATWAMMILGFGAVGAGMRRRKKVTMNVAYA